MWKILIVDDNSANRQLLLEYLQGEAMCNVAVDGREALRAHATAIARSQPYDLILMDVAMPDMDGLTALKAIRAAEQEAGVSLGAGVPVIMVTAHENVFMDAFSGGCDDFIIKPVDPDRLLAKIRSKLAARGGGGDSRAG